MYEKIKKWYKQGLWTKQMVLNAIAKNVLTESQASKILSGVEV
jgi:hypothetical protein